MNIKRFRLFPLCIIAWVMTFYFLATGVTDWRLWIPLVFLFVERLVTQIGLWFASRIMTGFGKAFQDELQSVVKNARS